MKTSLLARVLFCASALLYSTLASSALAQEVVVNGGFETGGFLPDWTVVDPSDSTVLGNDSAFAHTGDWKVYLGTSPVGAFADLGSLSQTLTTTPGATYTLSFWLANDGAADPPTSLNEFDVFWNGALTPILSLTAQPTFDYTEYTFSLAATGASTLLKFRYGNDADYFRLDDVSVAPAPVPEPSATWLVLPGMGILGLVHYRSARRRRLSAPV